MMNTIVKRIPFEIMASLIAAFVSAIALGTTFGVSVLMQRYVALHEPAKVAMVKTALPSGALVAQGHSLYLMNCAHCHADDATGDEGPDLHGVKKSDTRIASIIQNGIKGEMPKFGQKFKDGDVQALIAFIRSLKD